MRPLTERPTGTTPLKALRLGIILAAASMSGACSQLGGEGALDLLASAPAKENSDASANAGSAVPLTELEKATDYWGKAYAKAPQKAENGLNYAKNLKAMGRKSEAFSVLQAAIQLHNNHKPIAAEYGRLALELDQTTLAAQLLEFADDPAAPDWRVISARGAAMAKLGKTKDAIVHLERAQKLAPAQASVLNNLALAYTMDGQPEKAEELLRQAVASDSANAKTKQNLALVLGLQGKYDEATAIGSTAVAANVARENTDLLRKMVKLDPKSSPVSFPATVIASEPVPVPAPGNVAFRPTSADSAPSAEAWNSSTTVVTAAGN
ncbi:MAG: tetratricopeptide repeat protein [Hyphomicrobium sp.]|nr:tetratricopeptide repeat protein [Hyphomicrobium sp.]